MLRKGLSRLGLALTLALVMVAPIAPSGMICCELIPGF